MTGQAQRAKKSDSNAIWSTAIWQARHFALAIDGKVTTVMLQRSERKNPLTFESYAELRDFFRHLVMVDSGKAVLIADEFCPSGDVRGIIGPLVHGALPGLPKFIRMIAARAHATASKEPRAGLAAKRESAA